MHLIIYSTEHIFCKFILLEEFYKVLIFLINQSEIGEDLTRRDNAHPESVHFSPKKKAKEMVPTALRNNLLPGALARN